MIPLLFSLQLLAIAITTCGTIGVIRGIQIDITLTSTDSDSLSWRETQIHHVVLIVNELVYLWDQRRRNLTEQSLDVVPCLCTYLSKHHIQRFCLLLTLVVRNLAFVCEVGLVPDKNDHDIVPTLCTNVFDPLVGYSECVPACNVINNYCDG